MPDGRWTPPPVLLAVDLVIFTLRESVLHVLLVERGIDPFRGALALPGGFLATGSEDIITAAHRELHEEANLDATRLHLEQLGAYGTPDRDPRGRVVSVAYLAIAPGLPEPLAGTDAAHAAWTPVSDILTHRARLAFDHEQILNDGLERARAKLEHTALATAFCARHFTINDLQKVYEAVWGVELDPRNFYRKVQAVDGFIVPMGAERRAGRGRPARLFTSGTRTALFPPLVRPTPMTAEARG
ncbi:NUDIX domain-containing protein [Amycolatopsis sp. A133]|uniref:NUDIX hydrolase n=1 Tax=Amycolatopsis sp. A133 TaxID=3064472 RepID=UPI0027FEB706|nr:NUDIX domain-containing protein [Amycolatopsis sp. A133]MDQ7802355.1 NUDIX domain-containing protein [Amycolatopsis sp. A133]